MKFLKTTLIGGVLFLIPVTVIVLIVAKVAGVMIVIAEPMAGFIPIDNIGGVALANIIAVLIVLLLCFFAGLLARTDAAQSFAEKIEETVLQKIPGYTVLKGIKDTLSPEHTADLKPVFVNLGSTSRIGVEVERMTDGRVVVYLPNSPNVWAGTTRVVADSQVQIIDQPIMSVVDHVEQLGRGTEELLKPAPGDRQST